VYKIVQIYYDDASLKNCYLNQHVTPLFNPAPTKYFENSVILDSLKEIPHYYYFGVWSHKHKSKVHGKPFNFTEFEKRFINTDVFAFQRLLTNGRIFSGQQEKDYGILFNNLMETLKLKYRFPIKPKFVVMQNHFICKSKILTEYISKVLAPAIEFMDVHNEYDRKVSYTGPVEYTFKPFICEKLFSAFINDKNLKCEHW
jgi:hypothetical protein